MTDDIEPEQQQFGKFRLRRRLGSGGMAEVFLAELVGPQGFSRLLALKRILPTLSKEEEFIDAFISEARVGGSLIHPNIVPTVELGREGDFFYLAMEYVEGVTLEQLIRHRKKHKEALPLRLVLDIMRQVADGLEYAHNAMDPQGNPLRLVHRDLKPANILLSRHGVVRLTDFGVAKAESNLNRTATGIVKGTVAYMSPEQARDEPLDRRSDLYSFGSILFELLVLEKVFPNAKGLVGLSRVAAGDVSAQLAKLEPFPPELVAIVSRALTAELDERYASAREISQDLEAFGRSLPPSVDLGTLVQEIMAADESAREVKQWADSLGPGAAAAGRRTSADSREQGAPVDATRPDQLAFQEPGPNPSPTRVLKASGGSGSIGAGPFSSGAEVIVPVGGAPTAALRSDAASGASDSLLIKVDARGQVRASRRYGWQIAAALVTATVVAGIVWGPRLFKTDGDSREAVKAPEASSSTPAPAAASVGSGVSTGHEPGPASAPVTSAAGQPGDGGSGSPAAANGGETSPAAGGGGETSPATGGVSEARGERQDLAADGSDREQKSPQGGSSPTDAAAAPATGARGGEGVQAKDSSASRSAGAGQPGTSAASSAKATQGAAGRRLAGGSCEQLLNPSRAEAGYLNINAVPYAYVYLNDCKVTDTTPLIELAVRPGRYRVHLKTSDGRTRELDHPVVITTGEVTKEPTVRFQESNVTP